jgi:thioredoxin-like negative regulator of GroEL
VDVDQEPAIVRTYAITGTPTLVLMDAFGTELFRVTGALSRENMLQLLDETPHSLAKLNALSATLAADTDDFAALTAMGRELRAEAFFRASNELYGRALKTKEGTQATPARAEILSAMGRNALAMRAFPDAARWFDEALKQTPGQTDPDLLLGLGMAHVGQGNIAAARKALDAVIARHAGTPAATQAAKLRSTLPSS